MKLWLNEKYVNNLPRTIRFTVYLKILELLADMLSRTTRRLRQYTLCGRLIAEWTEIKTRDYDNKD